MRCEGPLTEQERSYGEYSWKAEFDPTRTSVDHLTDCRKPPRTPPECYSLARYDAWGGQMRRREFSVCLAVRWRGRSLRAVRQTGEVSRMGDRCATPKVNFS